MVKFYKIIPLFLFVAVCIGIVIPMLISAKSGIAFTLGVILLLAQPAVIVGYFKLFFKKGSNK